MSFENLDPILVLDLVARCALGLNFFVSGLNGFFHWFPLPEPRPAMGRFLQGLQETGFLMTVVKVFEIAGGFCLLTGFFVPLALLLLGPIVFVIVLSQAVLNRGRAWGMTLLLAVPFVVLLGTRWDYFGPFFRP